MKRVYSIDWLSLWCSNFQRTDEKDPILITRWDEISGNTPERSGELFSPLQWEYKVADHGTRQFRHLVEVNYMGELFASVCYEPCGSLFDGSACMVKFANRVLYQHDCWEMVDRFLRDHKMKVLNITRLDICCDFNHFEHYPCVKFIADFMSSKIRRVGRGIGAGYFNHYGEKVGTFSRGRLNYTGLSFGDKRSDVRIYLYNKSFELNCAKDKPYIKDHWVKGGLNTRRDVWRLEVSCGSKALHFEDKRTKEDIRVSLEEVETTPDMVKIYHTFTKKLWQFIVNHDAITNITRESRLDLFGSDVPYYDRAVLRSVTGSTRTERILIKQLHLLADNYRSPMVKDYRDMAKALASDLAAGTDLSSWYNRKQWEWKSDHYK